MSELKQTPSQTVGPYFAYGITPEQYRYNHRGMADHVLYKNTEAEGERILIRGQVLDGEGVPVDDALIELRQDATPEGFGRMGTGTLPDHHFEFDTLRPEGSGNAAPHINVIVLMRGLLNHLFTRIYFSDEAEANASDPLLSRVPEARHHTLIAQRSLENGRVVYRFDIRMQGPEETVFFDA